MRLTGNDMLASFRARSSTSERDAVPVHVTKTHLALVAYGLVLAVCGVLYLNSHIPLENVVLQQSRQVQIENSIQLMKQGGPPLLTSSAPYKVAVQHPSQLTEANMGDDPGIYLYLPLIGRVTGDANALSLLKWFFIGSMALLLLSYPLVFYLLFDSLLVGIVAPLIVLFTFDFLWNTEIYWVPAWAALLCLPIVFVVARRRWRPRRSLLCLFAVSVIASYASSIRSNAGTPIVLAAIAVAVLRERGVIRRSTRGGSADPRVPGREHSRVRRAQEDRDHIAHYHSDVLPTSHPFWHPAYLGLGYLPNRWGIRWNDTVADTAAKHVDPNVAYLSPHYEHILEHLYFQIARQDPGYLLSVYFTKIAVCINAAVSHFWPALLVLPFALAFGSYRRQMRLDLLLVVPALLLTLAPAVMTIPALYDTGWLGTLGLLELLAVGWLIVTAREVVRELEDGDRPGDGQGADAPRDVGLHDCATSKGSANPVASDRSRRPRRLRLGRRRRVGAGVEKGGRHLLPGRIYASDHTVSGRRHPAPLVAREGPAKVASARTRYPRRVRR